MSLFSSNSTDVFRTQADTRFNSFAEPMNPVNMNPGNWGVNSAYLTPSYLSPFRPQYQGQPGNPYAGYRPSFLTSVNQVANPFAPGGDNYGGNYAQQTSPYYDTLFNKPMDATASFAQNLVIPGAATFAAYKYWGKGATSLGSRIGGRALGGMAVGAGFGHQAASVAIRSGKFMGGLAGGLLLPMAAAQVGIDALDSAVFDPYVAQRRMTGNIRDNFAGVTFGEGSGSPFTGGGMSRQFAAGISKQMSKASAMDMTFNQNETSLLMDYASRSGLMDNTSADQMAKRFESVMKQVKVVMAVANTSDFKETIEIMSKMQMAGVNPTQLASVMGQLGGHAAAGGVAMQKMFNTVGTQAQYMFGASGITPYLGQLTAGGAMAAMNTAFRSNLISPALMARMGGPEGATQSAVAGSIAAYKTPYASIMASNAYLGGGEQGGVIGNMAQFGGRIASNPLEMAGQYEFMGDTLASAHMRDQGLLGEQRQIAQIAKLFPGSVTRDGKIGTGAAYLTLTRTMGLTPEAAKAKIAEIAAHNDPKTHAALMMGQNRAAIDSLLKYQQQEGLSRGIFTTPINAIRRAGGHVQKTMAEAVGTVQEATAGVSDYIQEFMYEGLFRTSRAQNTDIGFGEGPVHQVNTSLIDFMGSAVKEAASGRSATTGVAELFDLRKINALAKDRDPNALKYLDPKASRRERLNALDNLAKNTQIPSRYRDSARAEKLLSLTSSMGVEVDGSAAGSSMDLVAKNLNQVFSGTLSQSTEYLSLMGKVHQAMSAGGSANEADRIRLAQLMGVDPDSLSDAKLREKAASALAKAGDLRVSHVMEVGTAATTEELEGKLKAAGLPALSAQVQAGMDDASTAQQVMVQQGLRRNRAQLMKLHKAGIIDTNETMAGLTSLDNKETVGKFSDAVNRFGAYVEATKPKGIIEKFFGGKDSQAGGPRIESSVDFAAVAPR